MRGLVMLFVAMSISFMASAQSTDKEKIISEINRLSSEINSLECNFEQTKHLAILSDRMVSHGKMYFVQPGMLRWEYTTPYQYLFILNGNQVLLGNEGRKDIIDVNQNKMFREIAGIMMNSIMGKCLSDDKSFKVTIAEAPEEWVATLVPLKREMKQMWSKLVLHFDRKSENVSIVEMYENNGDYTTIRLLGVKKNQSIDSKMFDIE